MPSPINAPSDALRRPLYPEIVREPAGLARELDWRGELFGLAARFAAVAGVVTVVALLFFILVPAAGPSDTASTSSEITGSTKTAQPQPDQVDLASKPALAQFHALLATAPVSQPATQEQSEQLLQGFMQWRQKANSPETLSVAQPANCTREIATGAQMRQRIAPYVLMPIAARITASTISSWVNGSYMNGLKRPTWSSVRKPWAVEIMMMVRTLTSVSSASG